MSSLLFALEALKDVTVTPLCFFKAPLHTIYTDVKNSHAKITLIGDSGNIYSLECNKYSRERNNRIPFCIHEASNKILCWHDIEYRIHIDEVLLIPVRVHYINLTTPIEASIRLVFNNFGLGIPQVDWKHFVEMDVSYMEYFIKFNEGTLSSFKSEDLVPY